jgi:hypothetical protein
VYSEGRFPLILLASDNLGIARGIPVNDPCSGLLFRFCAAIRRELPGLGNTRPTRMDELSVMEVMALSEASRGCDGGPRVVR